MNFRPDKIGLLFGQEHLMDLLLNWTNSPINIPNNLLICGPYGIGKTSLARIFARLLTNEIRDIEEINAAEARGIDDVRSWGVTSRLSALGQARIYIIDELHQMTTAAQSAFLKILEDHPKSTYFFLCTTEPHKLLPTIASRCTPIELKLLNNEASFELISYLSKGSINTEIADKIVKKTAGHARDIVNLVNIILQGGNIETVVLPGSQISNIKELLYNMSSSKDINIFKQLLLCDQSAIGQSIDEFVDTNIVQPTISTKYYELLQIRSMRKEYKVNSHEQLAHLWSIFN